MVLSYIDFTCAARLANPLPELTAKNGETSDIEYACK